MTEVPVVTVVTVLSVVTVVKGVTIVTKKCEKLQFFTLKIKQHIFLVRKIVKYDKTNLWKKNIKWQKNVTEKYEEKKLLNLN